jgi:hypothetical protein
MQQQHSTIQMKKSSSSSSSSSSSQQHHQKGWEKCGKSGESKPRDDECAEAKMELMVDGVRFVHLPACTSPGSHCRPMWRACPRRRWRRSTSASLSSPAPPPEASPPRPLSLCSFDFTPVAPKPRKFLKNPTKPTVLITRPKRLRTRPRSSQKSSLAHTKRGLRLHVLLRDGL